MYTFNLEEAHWRVLSIYKPTSNHPIVVINPGIALSSTKNMLKNVANYYGEESVIVSPDKGVYDWRKDPALTNLHQQRASSLSHALSDLNQKGLFAHVVWVKSLIGRGIIPSVIVASSKGGLIVNDIWKYVWKGKTIIWNGFTAALPNVVYDKEIFPIFLMGNCDPWIHQWNLISKIRNKWKPNQYALVKFLTQGHYAIDPSIFEMIPIYLQLSGGEYDAKSLPLPPIRYREFGEEKGGLKIFNDDAQFESRMWDLYRPSGVYASMDEEGNDSTSSETDDDSDVSSSEENENFVESLSSIGEGESTNPNEPNKTLDSKLISSQKASWTPHNIMCIEGRPTPIPKSLNLANNLNMDGSSLNRIDLHCFASVPSTPRPELLSNQTNQFAQISGSTSRRIVIHKPLSPLKIEYVSKVSKNTSFIKAMGGCRSI